MSLLSRRIPPAALLALYLSASTTAQAGPTGQPPGLGDAPPALHVAEALNAESSPDLDWKAHRGKVVVLEFFGTWCAPCVAGLPKINALVESLDPEQFRWWLLADQKAEVLKAFLQEREVVPPVLIDAGSKTTGAFQPSQYPLAVVIGPDGRVAARLHPAELTTERLDRILAGEQITSPYIRPKIPADLRWDAKAGFDSLSDNAFAQAVLQRSKADLGGSVVDGDRGRLVADGVSLQTLTALAYDTDTDLVETHGFDDSARFRISIRSADNSLSSARRLLRELLTASFPATVEVSSVAQDRVVLERIPGEALQLEEMEKIGAAGGTWSDEGEVDLEAAPSAFLARMVAIQAYGMSFKAGLDRTGLPGNYRVRFRYDPKDPDSLQNAFRSMGLRFEKRVVERPKVRFERRLPESGNDRR